SFLALSVRNDLDTSLACFTERIPFFCHSLSILSIYLKLSFPIKTASLNAALISCGCILSSSNQTLIVSISKGEIGRPNSCSNNKNNSPSSCFCDVYSSVNNFFDNGCKLYFLLNCLFLFFSSFIFSIFFWIRFFKDETQYYYPIVK